MAKGSAKVIWRGVTSWVTVGALAAISGALSAPVSRLAINPQEVRIVGDQVSIHRQFPSDTFNLPRPRLSYIETVKGFSPETNRGHVCKDSAGPFRYSDAKNVGQWSIEWAYQCLDDPIGFEWEACWTWHLGAIRFGAVCKQHISFREGE